jgi:chromosome partitioning protein
VTSGIAIANQKSGVGKIRTAVCLSHGLALVGHCVLLVDFDPQGKCATPLAINLEAGVFNVLVNPSYGIHP